jgi:enterochelin esterase-like enzyme
MRSRLVLVPLLVLGLVPNIRAQDDYQPGPDSLVQAGVPKGGLIKGTYTSKEGSVFPGTERDYTIYRPPSTGSGPIGKPSPFMVFQDGVIYNAPVVFDNLIAKGQIPPLIGIFIKPGIVPAANPNALPRYNRSYEYDSVSDTYSRFLIDEFLSAIEAKHGIKLSTDPNDAAISGNSSGGICAFMTAWHRPDRFRRVFSGVGTYVGIHGADQLPVLVRKYEPKPLRIYLQSGEHDNDLYCGDWWMANQTMERALKWAGYDVNHTWGTGGHNSKHATAIFPDVMKWLWRDYADTAKKEIKANPRGDSKWVGYGVLGDGKWEVAANRDRDDINKVAASKDGTVFFSFDSKNAFGQISTANEVSIKSSSLGVRAMTVQSDGSLLLAGEIPNAISEHRKAVSIQNGSEAPVSSDRIANAEGLAVSAAGNVFVSYLFSISNHDQTGKEVGRGFDSRPHKIWFGCEALSPDQSLLYLTEKDGAYIYSAQIRSDGELVHVQPFFELQSPQTGSVNACGLCVDTNGWLYVATALGIQVCDQAGRVNFIIPTPQQPHDVCFGGKDLGELFIACGDKIYKRPTKAHGIVSGQMAPIKPAPPKL